MLCCVQCRRHRQLPEGLCWHEGFEMGAISGLLSIDCIVLRCTDMYGVAKQAMPVHALMHMHYLLLLPAFVTLAADVHAYAVHMPCRPR